MSDTYVLTRPNNQVVVGLRGPDPVEIAVSLPEGLPEGERDRRIDDARRRVRSMANVGPPETASNETLRVQGFPETGRVVMQYSFPTERWVLTPDDAERVAQSLIQQAAKARR